MAGDLLGQQRLGERIELLQPDDGHGVVAGLGPRGEQVVGHLPGAEQQPLHPRLATGRRVGDEALEPAGGEGGQWRAGLLAAEQALGSHDHQRLSPGTDRLASQQVEDLRAAGGVADLDVVLGGHGEEALQARAGVLGPRALVAVGKQEREPAQPAPLVLGGDDELVDDDLRPVGEVTELRLPEDQRVGVVQRVAELEAHAPGLGERAVVDLEPPRSRPQVLERHVDRAGLRVVEHGVAMSEGAALGVLAGEPDVSPGAKQGGVGQVLAGRPIQRNLAASHRPAALEDLPQLPQRREPLRHTRQVLEQRDQRLFRNPGLGLGDAFLGPAAVALPQALVGARLAQRGRLLGLVVGLEEVPLGLLAKRLGVLGAHPALLGERLRVELGHRRVVPDRLVHQRLGVARLVALVVAVAPEAHEVDHDVALEALPVLGGQAHHVDAGLGVVPVHVEDGDVEHLRDGRGVDARARVLGVGGVADLVVDDDVDGAAGVVAPEPREVQRLCHHALRSHRRVAVDDQRKHLAPVLPVEALLLGARPSLHHRVDDLEVAGVEGQAEVDALPGGGGHVRGEAQVILHVAPAHELPRVHRPVELAEDLIRALPQHVGEDVQPAAVGHADDDLLDAQLAAELEHGVEHRQERLTAVHAEALRALVLGVDEGLEGVGVGQRLEDPPLLRGARVQAVLGVLHPRHQPASARRVVERHVLHADVHAVGAAQPGEQLAELDPLPVGEDLGAVHHLVELLGAEGRVAGHRQVGDVVHLRTGTPQRIDLGEEVPPQAERVQRLVHPRLQLHRGEPCRDLAHRHQLAPRRSAGHRGTVPAVHRPRGPRRTIAGGMTVGRPHLAVAGGEERTTLVAGPGEELAPARVDRGGVLEPAGVQALDEVDVGAREKRVRGVRHGGCAGWF